MTAWTQFFAGLIRAFNLIAGWVRDEGLKRQGASRAELEILKTRNQIRRKADAIDSALDNATGPDSDRDILERL
ncbi:MAG: hypothetical protein HN377_03875 [Alphaproteobacteria bacterium]|jgi:hypothetical protein|nr:hypothetical protein [Alphaproteobacteria bacterium]MBT7944134.1 hypothetical protein [Alphaproteobacteria bacterium]